MVVIKYIAKCLQIVRCCLRQNIKSQKKGKQKNERTHPLLCTLLSSRCAPLHKGAMPEKKYPVCYSAKRPR